MDRNDVKVREEDGDVVFETPSGKFKFPFGRETIDDTRLNTVLGFIERYCAQLEETTRVRLAKEKARRTYDVVSDEEFNKLLKTIAIN
jgi:hypothetical protein